MKKLITPIILLLFISTTTFSQKRILPTNDVAKLKDFESFYQSGDFYLGAQPSFEMLEYIKTNGVTTVINLRSDEENKDFTKQAFNEKRMVEKMGIKYISIPMKGKDDYNSKTLLEFTNVLESSNGKILVHCKKGGRVTLVMMAWLMKTQNYTLQQAEEFGSQLTYFNYVEALLNE